MSAYSLRIKQEIFAITDKPRHCRLAEALGLLNAGFAIDGGAALKPLTDSALAAAKLAELIERDFASPAAAARALAAGDGGAFDPLTVKSPCCKRAYIRGAFLCAGYAADPAVSYRLEFTAPLGRGWQGLAACLRAFGISPKTAVRNGRHVIYLKEAEQVSELLSVIGAHALLLGFENSRVENGVANNINRLANCEAANADKLVSAAVRQVEDIRRVEAAMGLGALPPRLEELARLRLAHPALPISELARLLNPPVSKSGVSHRLRRISAIAGEIGDRDGRPTNRQDVIQ